MTKSRIRKCSKCHRRPARVRQAWCGPCHAEFMRGWRLKRKNANEAMQAELVRLRQRLTTTKNLP